MREHAVYVEARIVADEPEHAEQYVSSALKGLHEYWQQEPIAHGDIGPILIVSAMPVVLAGDDDAARTHIVDALAKAGIVTVTSAVMEGLEV